MLCSCWGRRLVICLLFSIAESFENVLSAYEPNTPFSWPQHAATPRVPQSGLIMPQQRVIAEQSEVVPSASLLEFQTVRAAKVQTRAQSSAAAVELDKIFPMLFVMYGSLGIFWFLFSKMPAKPEGHQIKVALLCFTWCSMSIGMHTLNKALAVLLGAPSLIALSQMLVSVIIFGAMAWRDVLESDRSEILIWMIVPFFFAAMLISSFYTFQLISLSMLTVLRNLSPLIVLPIETLLMPPDKQPLINRTVVGSIFVMLCGAAVYGGNIADLSWPGVGFALMNMVLACSDRLIQRRLLTDQCKGLTSSTCSILNNGFAMIPTTALAIMTQEVSNAIAPENVGHWTDPQTLFLLALSGLVGMGMCYFGFECQREVSATSFFVMNNLAKVAVVSVGITVFGDPLSSPWSLFGLVLSLSGSFFYGKAQMDSKSVPAAPTETQKLVARDSQTAKS